jgi:hypothetical protein
MRPIQNSGRPSRRLLASTTQAGGDELTTAPRVIVPQQQAQARVIAQDGVQAAVRGLMTYWLEKAEVELGTL